MKSFSVRSNRSSRVAGMYAVYLTAQKVILKLFMNAKKLSLDVFDR